ncbi:MAG: hypothetical protein OEY88_00415 [Candidatus Bathyarchaeota archaeon]|nr:hypothetical protein [Candidatus Bathyarchaeota archaeon]
MYDHGEGNGKNLVKKLLPRILKAAFKSIIAFVLIYLIPSLLLQDDFLPAEYKLSMNIFAVIIILFIVIVELTSGTIFQYIFSFLRVIVLIVFFIFTLGRGSITVTIEMLYIAVDLSIILAMLIFVELLGLAKTVLGAVHFLSQKNEKHLNSR